MVFAQQKRAGHLSKSVMDGSPDLINVFLYFLYSFLLYLIDLIRSEKKIHIEFKVYLFNVKLDVLRKILSSKTPKVKSPLRVSHTLITRSRLNRVFS